MICSVNRLMFHFQRLEMKYFLWTFLNWNSKWLMTTIFRRLIIITLRSFWWLVCNFFFICRERERKKVSIFLFPCCVTNRQNSGFWKRWEPEGDYSILVSYMVAGAQAIRPLSCAFPRSAGIWIANGTVQSMTAIAECNTGTRSSGFCP